MIKSIETGICLDAFRIGPNSILESKIGKELPIMAITRNKKTFLTFYINMNFIFGHIKENPIINILMLLLLKWK